jgi:hypothetical protein
MSHQGFRSHPGVERGAASQTATAGSISERRSLGRGRKKAETNSSQPCRASQVCAHLAKDIGVSEYKVQKAPELLKQVAMRDADPRCPCARTDGHRRSSCAWLTR